MNVKVVNVSIYESKVIVLRIFSETKVSQVKIHKRDLT